MEAGGSSTGIADSSGEDLLNETLEELTGVHTIPKPIISSSSKEVPVSSNGQTLVKTSMVAAVTASPTKGDEAKKVSVTKVEGPDKLAVRAARFGVVTESASSSNLTGTSTMKTAEQLEALKKRAERFGEVVSDAVKTLEVKEKMNQRANRFNLSTEDASASGKLGLIKKTLPSPTMKRVTSTALTPEQQERIKKRRERFGLV